MAEHRLRLELDGKEIFDQEVVSVHLDYHRAQNEIRSNPLMAAALAGAPSKVLLDLPGEQIIGYEGNTDITLDIRLRINGGYHVHFLDKPQGVW